MSIKNHYPAPDSTNRETRQRLRERSGDPDHNPVVKRSARTGVRPTIRPDFPQDGTNKFITAKRKGRITLPTVKAMRDDDA